MTTAAPRRRPRAALVVIGLAALGLFAAFVSLGVWQLERRVWKLNLIERVEARVRAAPVPPPSPADWPNVSADRDEYRRVALVGSFERSPEVFVQATTELGAGFWTLAPFRTRDGFVVLVNRGFVAPERRNPAARQPPPAVDTTVTGLLRITEPHGAFLRANEPGNDIWRSRDVSEIARARGLGEVAPYFVDADGTPNPGGWPVGGLTVVSFRNNHLVYALTWFALAAMSIGGVAIFFRHEHVSGKSA